LLKVIYIIKLPKLRVAYDLINEDAPLIGKNSLFFKNVVVEVVFIALVLSQLI